jgi:hypothetical protein
LRKEAEKALIAEETKKKLESLIKKEGAEKRAAEYTAKAKLEAEEQARQTALMAEAEKKLRREEQRAAEK